MTIVKLPAMDQNEIKNALRKEKLCRIAFIEDQFPYISPFQYVNLNDKLYFHFTDYGKKINILKKNNRVCVSIEHFEKDLSIYYFISIQGKLIIVEDAKEKALIVQNIFKEAKENFSRNFLSAHGFERDNEWDEIEKSNLLIYKLEVVGEPIGLKSL